MDVAPVGIKPATFQSGRPFAEPKDCTALKKSLDHFYIMGNRTCQLLKLNFTTFLEGFYLTLKYIFIIVDMIVSTLRVIL